MWSTRFLFIQLLFWDTDTPPKFDMEPEHECLEPTEIARGEPGEPCEI